MRFTRFSRFLASAVAVALIASTTPNLFAASNASMMGRVTGADGLEPRAGVVVALVDSRGEAVSRSKPSDARGSFAVTGAPAGSYRVVVETDSGAYLASNGVSLKAGENGPVSLSLKPATQNAQTDPTVPPPSTPPPPPPADAGATPPPSGLQPWAKWLIVGGIVVGGAIIVSALNDDDESSGY